MAAGSCSGAAPRAESAFPPEPSGPVAEQPVVQRPVAERPGVERPGVERLRRRAQFVRAQRGVKVVQPGFVLQVRDRRDDDDRIGIGFTASRRVGNAVKRNRVRRRLKEVARLHLPAHGIAGCDHVLVARREGLCRPFSDLVRDFEEACARARGRLRR